MRGVLGYFKAFRGDGIVDRERPNVNVGMAFLAAAVIVAFIGFRWMGSEGGTASAGGNGWALGGNLQTGGGTTTIPASPAAVAVRVGAQTPAEAAEAAISGSGLAGTATSMLPDGTPIVIGNGGPGTTGSTGGTGTTRPWGTTTTVVTTVSSEPTTTTTEPTSSTSDTTSSTTDTTSSTTETTPPPPP